MTAMNFRRAVYRGRPVLTWWEGKADLGLGRGEHVIVDGLQKVAPGKPVKPVPVSTSPAAAPQPADTGR